MSKKKKNAMENGAPTQEQPAKKQKTVGYRILAVLLLAVCVLAVVGITGIVEFGVFYANNEIKKVTLLTAIQDIFASDAKLFGFLPTLSVPGGVGTLLGLSTYLFLIGLAVTAVLSLIAVFTKKAPALVRTALFFLLFGSLAYTLSYTIAGEALKNGGVLTAEGVCLDFISLGFAGFAIVMSLVLALIKNGKSVWMHALQLLLTLGYTALLVIAIAGNDLLVVEQVADGNALYKTLTFVAIALIYVNVLIGCARMAKKTCHVCDLVRFIFALIVALLVCYVENAANTGESKLVYAICAAVITVVQIVIVIILIRKAHKKELAVSKEEAQQEATQGFHTEEYAETYAYEGGPVAGVMMAEEVNPSFLPQEPKVNTAGYDFYNCKSFDPFMASLNNEERNAFTELFIMRFRGTMPEIPEYKVGGDNSEFFRKVFIYLGQYRDRIPNALLTKMYQYSIKL